MHKINIQEIQKIYSHLEDDISKRIFNWRLLFGLTNDRLNLIRMVQECTVGGTRMMEILNKNKDKKKVIFGGGEMGEFLVTWWPDVQWDYFIDNNPEKCKQKLPVISVDSFLEKREEKAIIVISATIHYKKMLQQLLEAGIEKDNIIIVGSMIEEMFQKQYFDLPQLYHAEGESFVDGGCFNGSSSIQFINWCDHKYDNIYAFEPDGGNYIKCKDRLRDFGERIHLFHDGLWDKEEILHFQATANAGSRIDESGDVEVSVVKLDDVLANQKVTFLKLDVEGAELMALQGAEKIIRSQLPKIAVCVYHKREDIWEIPQLLLEYNPNYKFYLRHYSLKHIETVLYAL